MRLLVALLLGAGMGAASCCVPPLNRRVRRQQMPEQQPPSFREAFEFFANMPGMQLFFLALFAATWLIGGNIVVALHYRRLGKSVWSGFKPFAFPFKNFNALEWFSLLVLAIVSFAFGAIALSLNPR
jgi:hypothetical protein